VFDLAHGALLKLDAHGRVLRARRAGRWLTPAQSARIYPGHGEWPGANAAPALLSPFDAPAGYLFEALATPPTPAHSALSQLHTEVRVALDRTHVAGAFKATVARDLPAYVRPLSFRVEALAGWRAAGKSLFVLTNSDAGYTVAVLDHLFPGGAWRALFDVVVAAADKPAFFARGDGCASAGGCLVTGGGAAHVESLLGARGAAVLYAGDNPEADVDGAQRMGWRTVAVARERAASPHDPRVASSWGGPLRDAGRVTWLAARLARADLVCECAADVALLQPTAHLVPARGGGPAGLDWP
jgi:FMN phosphatase YigB (HAD superfamily)